MSDFCAIFSIMFSAFDMIDHSLSMNVLLGCFISIFRDVMYERFIRVFILIYTVQLIRII